MCMGTEVRFRSSVAALVVAASLMLSQPAAAQLFFDWGGEQKVNDSGRQLVKISTDARPGPVGQPE